MLILQQCRNIAICIKIQAVKSHTKPIDTPKLTTGHFIALQKKRDPAPPIRTPMQISLTRKLWQATSTTPPTGSNLHIKEEPQTSRIQKSHPRDSSLNKMKRQINIQQVKEHDKWAPNQTKQEKIRNLAEKQFRIMIVKMIQNLENKMEWQINRLETRIKKMN